MDKGLISIVTPAYNSERYIADAIESVKNQTYPLREHIIIDGGSYDRTMDIIREYENLYPLKWISEKDDGIADAMNKGFMMARGEIVTWLDADNWFAPEVFSTIADIFDNDKSIDIVYGNIIYIDNKKARSYAPPNNIDFKMALLHTTGAIPLQPGVFFKKSLFERVGGFDSNYKIACDFDFWLRVLKIDPKIHYLSETIGFYRSGISSAASQSISGLFFGFKEVLKISSLHGYSITGRINLIVKYCFGLVGSLKRYLSQ